MDAQATTQYWQQVGFRLHQLTNGQWVVFNAAAAAAVQYGMASVFAGPFATLAQADSHLRGLGLHLLAP